MTREDFHDYLILVASHMRLAHWMLKIDSHPPKNANAWASVVCWEGRFGATIYLSDDILTETPENQRYAMVHELVHCFFAQADKLAEDGMSGVQSNAWRLAMEYGVDAMANLIAPFMPLPRPLDATA